MEKNRHTWWKKLAAVREVLRSLPVKEREKSSVEVMGFLKADLRKAVKQGHSLKDIQAILAEQGISISLSGMETILGQSGKNEARKKTDSEKPSLKPRIAKPQEEAPKKETVKPDVQNPAPAREAEPRKMPSYFRPDLPDDQL